MTERAMTRYERRQARRAIRERDGDNCHWCGEPMIFGLGVRGETLPSIEHLKPLKRGGTDELSNLVLAHLGCNQARNQRDQAAERIWRQALKAWMAAGWKGDSYFHYQAADVIEAAILQARAEERAAIAAYVREQAGPETEPRELDGHALADAIEGGAHLRICKA